MGDGGGSTPDFLSHPRLTFFLGLLLEMLTFPWHPQGKIQVGDGGPVCVVFCAFLNSANTVKLKSQ